MTSREWVFFALGILSGAGVMGLAAWHFVRFANQTFYRLQVELKRYQNGLLRIATYVPKTPQDLIEFIRKTIDEVRRAGP